MTEIMTIPVVGKYRELKRAGQPVTVAKLDLPYIGMDESGNSTRNWAHMGFVRTNGELCPRQIKRAIRRWVRQYLGRTLHPEELRMAMKRVEYCVG